MSNKLRLKCANCGRIVIIDDFLADRDSTVFCSENCMHEYELLQREGF
jgi:endogenous inhibitor of DNA gyrase (YacG/DUF329 family)